jgi:hypothetical protein
MLRIYLLLGLLKMISCDVVQLKMLPSIILPLAQSETTKSSQPTRSLADFLAPRNLLVTWPSVPVTLRTTKHKFSKKTIIRNISSKDPPTSQSHPLFIKFPFPLPQVSSTPSLLAINLPYLDFWEMSKK